MHRLTAPLALLLAVLTAASALAPAAGARTHPAPGAHRHRIGGLVPDTGGRARGRVHAARDTPARLGYFGGPVLHHNRTHVIFWVPAGSGLSYPPGYEALVERFLGDVAADSHMPTNVYGLSGQYSDHHGPAAYDSRYAGATEASDPLPANGCTEPAVTGPGWSVCLTDGELQREIEHVVSERGLPRTGTDVYFLVLPDGLGNCTTGASTSCALGGDQNGYCGYHSETNSNLIYAVIPYNAVPGHCQSDNPRPNGSPADPTLSSLSHEHNEMVTDPDAYNAWIDSAGNEDGDLCITQFGPVIGGTGAMAWNEAIGGGHWYLQEEWSNEDGGCAPRDETDVVRWSVPARARAGHAVPIAARASDFDGSITEYRWSFGDGSGATRRTARHVYTRPGRYRVTLRVLDSADNWTFATRTVTVRRR